MKKKAKKDPANKVEKPVEKPAEVKQENPVSVPGRPTIAELEDMLNKEEEQAIQILPNGEVRVLKGKPTQKPLTMRENLGGEYAAA